MRKLVSTLFLIGMYGAVNAQTEMETINWLKQNKPKLDLVNCPTIDLYGENVEFTDDYVRLFDDNSSCQIKWKDVTEVKKKGEYFYLTSKESVDNKNLEIKFYIKDTNTANSFVNALKHITIVKSDNYVKNDIF